MDTLIIDNNTIVRELVASTVRSICPTARTEEATFVETLSLKPAATFKLVLIDLGDGGQPIFRLLNQVQRHSPDVLIAVISAHDGTQAVCRAHGLRAFDCLPRSANSSQLRTWLLRLLAKVAAMQPGSSRSIPTLARTPTLTRRQREVLDHLLAGLSNKVIARKLAIAESTVKLHVTAILRELKVQSRAQAMIAAARYHRISIPSGFGSQLVALPAPLHEDAKPVEACAQEQLWSRTSS